MFTTRLLRQKHAPPPVALEAQYEPHVSVGRLWKQRLKVDQTRAMFAPGFFQKLLINADLALYEHEIQKDITRTFPTHPLFVDPQGREHLANILRAFAVHDIELGYSQGMAFIAGFLMIHIRDQETVFWCMVSMFFRKKLDLRLMYYYDCVAIQLSCAALDRCISRCLPRLWAHFEAHEIKSQLFATSWFVCVFTYRFPLPFSKLVWDDLLQFGFSTVFRVAVALLEHLQGVLLDDSFDGMVSRLSDLHRLPLRLCYAVYKRSRYIDLSDCGCNVAEQYYELRKTHSRPQAAAAENHLANGHADQSVQQQDNRESLTQSSHTQNQSLSPGRAGAAAGAGTTGAQSRPHRLSFVGPPVEATAELKPAALCVASVMSAAAAAASAASTTEIMRSARSRPPVSASSSKNSTPKDSNPSGASPREIVRTAVITSRDSSPSAKTPNRTPAFSIENSPILSTLSTPTNRARAISAAPAISSSLARTSPLGSDSSGSVPPRHSPSSELRALVVRTQALDSSPSAASGTSITFFPPSSRSPLSSHTGRSRTSFNSSNCVATPSPNGRASVVPTPSPPPSQRCEAQAALTRDSVPHKSRDTIANAFEQEAMLTATVEC